MNFSLGVREVEYKNKIIIPPTSPKIKIKETQYIIWIFKIKKDLKREIIIITKIIKTGCLLKIKIETVKKTNNINISEFSLCNKILALGAREYFLN